MAQNIRRPVTVRYHCWGRDFAREVEAESYRVALLEAEQCLAMRFLNQRDEHGVPLEDKDGRGPIPFEVDHRYSSATILRFADGSSINMGAYTGVKVYAKVSFIIGKNDDGSDRWTDVMRIYSATRDESHNPL